MQRNEGDPRLFVCLCLVVDSVLCRRAKVSMCYLFVCLFVCVSWLMVCCAEEQRCPWVICLFVCLCLMVDIVLCRGTKVTLGCLDQEKRQGRSASKVADFKRNMLYGSRHKRVTSKCVCGCVCVCVRVYACVFV